MKEYDIKAIVNKDELKLIFECDKENNNKCKKNNCDICNHTTDSRYMKAKLIQSDKNISDQETIRNLEDEIDYYRHKIDLLNRVHEEDRRYINRQDKLIKEYQETFKEVIINKTDILNSRTPNQIRMLLGLDRVNKEN